MFRRFRNYPQIGGKRGGIPSGWVEVEWIANNSAGQMIDTGIGIDVGIKMEVVESYAITSIRQIWGASSVGWFFGCNANGYYEVNSFSTTYPITNDEPLTLTVNCTLKTVDLYADISIVSATNQYSLTDYHYPPRSGTINLFAFGSSYFAAGHRYYKVDFYRNENKVLSLVGVRNATTGEIAMCDVLTGDIYRNRGTGAFVAGPDKRE